MTDDKNETTTAGSERIVLAGNKGVMPASRTESQNENIPSGNEELAWGRRNIPEEHVPEPVRDVFRKTALHSSPPPEEDDLRKLRHKMLVKLKRKRPEILYMPFESAFRDFVTSLLARQYREEEELREQVAALAEQVGELQDRLEQKTLRIDRRLEFLEERGRSG